MATTLRFSPQTHNLKNQILNIQIIRNKALNSSSYLSWTRMLSPILDGSSQFSKLYSKIIKSNLINKRGLTSFSSLPNNHLRRARSSPLPILAMSFQSHSDGSNSISQDSTKTVRCMIKGRVQGVFYRNWTVENATQLGLKGWVRNRRDGSVEALFSGKAEVVDEMMQLCRRGPPDAMVTAFQANPCNDDPGVSFERKPTI